MPEPLIHPTLLFNFATSIQPFADVTSKKSSEGWSLDKRYAVPDFAELASLEANLKRDFRLAWDRSGIFLQFQITAEDSKTIAAIKNCRFRFWVDTRGAVGNKRLTKFCQRFDHDCDVFKSICMVRSGTGRDEKSDSEPAINIDGFDVRLAADKRQLTLYNFLPKSSLAGYQPDEFPQINYFYDFAIADNPPQPLSVGTAIKYDQDPSMWVRGNLARGAD